MRGATRGEVLARIELTAISDTVGRMWRHGSRRPQLADETGPALPHSPSWNQQQMRRLLLERGGDVSSDPAFLLVVLADRCANRPHAVLQAAPVASGR
jgi:hypothetical protein